MSDKDILFKAVESNNVSEMEEILKHCAHDILEFRGGEVSICSTKCFCKSLFVRIIVISQEKPNRNCVLNLSLLLQ